MFNQLEMFFFFNIFVVHSFCFHSSGAETSKKPSFDTTKKSGLFLVSAPLRGRALFHFLSLCHLLVLDVVCPGWGGWGGGW